MVDSLASISRRSAARHGAKVPTTARSTILVIDDEPEICELVSYNLAREGYRVLSERDGESGLERVFQSPPDLLVLDLLLPHKSGLEVLRAIRAEARTRTLPVLILTARGTEMDKLLGFEHGADDYLTKPFSPRELIARIGALIRRARPADQAPVIEHGALRIEPLAREVLLDGQALALTPREYELLVFLARHPGRVLSRDELLRKVWGYDYVGDTRTVDVHVRRLRAKLGEHQRHIETVTGAGYKFVGRPASS